MARAVDMIQAAQQAQGFDMVAGAAKVFTAPSLAMGTRHSGLTDGKSAAGSPGASLGTGSNVDLYTPGIEAV